MLPHLILLMEFYYIKPLYIWGKTEPEVTCPRSARLASISQLSLTPGPVLQPLLLAILPNWCKEGRRKSLPVWPWDRGRTISHRSKTGSKTICNKLSHAGGWAVGKGSKGLRFWICYLPAPLTYPVSLLLSKMRLVSPTLQFDERTKRQKYVRALCKLWILLMFHVQGMGRTYALPGAWA